MQVFNFILGRDKPALARHIRIFLLHGNRLRRNQGAEAVIERNRHDLILVGLIQKLQFSLHLFRRDVSLPNDMVGNGIRYPPHAQQIVFQRSRRDLQISLCATQRRFSGQQKKAQVQRPAEHQRNHHGDGKEGPPYG